MQLRTVETDRGPRPAVIVGGQVGLLAPGVDVLAMLVAEPGERDAMVAEARESLPLVGASLLAPLRPTTLRDFTGAWV